MQPYKGKEESAKAWRRVYVVVAIAVVSMTPLTSAQNPKAGANLVASVPLPTGRFPVGLRYFEWFDDSRKMFANRSRVIPVLIFYPSETRSGKHAEYFRGASQLPLNEQTASLRDEFGAAWKSVADGELRSNALENAPIIQTKTKLPVILFSPGLGVSSSAYSAQLTDLASHGYVVVATDHVNDSPLLVLSDGTMIPFDKSTWTAHQPPGPPTFDGLKFAVQRQAEWLSDSNFVLRALRSRSTTPFFNALELAHVGALGHSFGGVVAAKLCQTSDTIQACVNEDGELFGRTLRPGEAVPSLDPALPVKKPLLIFTLIEPSMKQIPEYMQVRRGSHDDLIKFLNTRTAHSYLIAIDRPDIRHMSFTDIALLHDGPDRTGSLRFSEFTRKVSLSFFDQFLKGRVSDHLDDMVSHSDIGSMTTYPH